MEETTLESCNQTDCECIKNLRAELEARTRLLETAIKRLGETIEETSTYTLMIMSLIQYTEESFRRSAQQSANARAENVRRINGYMCDFQKRIQRIQGTQE